MQSKAKHTLNRPIVVGKIGAPYGVKGWLKLFPSTEDKEAIFDYMPWYLRSKGQLKLAEVDEWKWHGQDLIVKLKSIDDRDIAHLLTNAEVVIEETDLPLLDDGEYYWKDLINCRVSTEAGYDMGVVTELMETGSNDVLVVRANLNDAFGAKERLIPYLDETVIKSVDIVAKNIIVDWDPSF
ncbi:ribosome maturation factor RimM [Thorsellia kenyensis]|uniref:Ribosome maturation factor RimM n=1 Tax=Thorsellia kenyensis TaxID=1549888 RepID=A0ABV6CD84_9GAMM